MLFLFPGWVLNLPLHPVNSQPCSWLTGRFHYTFTFPGLKVKYWEGNALWRPCSVTTNGSANAPKREPNSQPPNKIKETAFSHQRPLSHVRRRFLHKCERITKGKKRRRRMRVERKEEKTVKSKLCTSLKRFWPEGSTALFGLGFSRSTTKPWPCKTVLVIKPLPCVSIGDNFIVPVLQQSQGHKWF